MSISSVVTSPQPYDLLFWDPTTEMFVNGPAGSILGSSGANVPGISYVTIGNTGNSDYNTTWTVPPGVTLINIQTCGGGGGGGGASSSEFAGTGGGAAASYIGNLPVLPNETLSIQIGTYGAFGTAGPASDGGNTIIQGSLFGSLCCGAGGAGNSYGSTLTVSGGNGGAVSYTTSLTADLSGGATLSTAGVGNADQFNMGVAWDGATGATNQAGRNSYIYGPAIGGPAAGGVDGEGLTGYHAGTVVGSIRYFNTDSYDGVYLKSGAGANSYFGRGGQCYPLSAPSGFASGGCGSYQDSSGWHDGQNGQPGFLTIQY